MQCSTELSREVGWLGYLIVVVGGGVVCVGRGGDWKFGRLRGTYNLDVVGQGGGSQKNGEDTWTSYVYDPFYGRYLLIESQAG